MRMLVCLVPALLLWMSCYANASDSLAQIALVYKEAQTSMQKMQQARDDGNQQEVKRIQNRLESYIQRQKDLARVNLSATRASILEVESDSGSLTAQQKEAIEARLAACRQQLSLYRTAVKQVQVRYYQENKENRLLREKAKAAIIKAGQHADKAISEHESVISGYEDEMVETQKILEENIRNNKKDLSRWKDSDPRKKGVEENYAKYAAKVATGDMRPHPMHSSINELKKKIQDRKKMIADIQAAVADETYRDHPMHHSIGQFKDLIKALEQQDADRRAAFKAGDYLRLKAKLAAMNNARISCIGYQVQLGDSQDRLSELKSVEQQLQIFLEHEFVTSLPKEKALWEKAISFCTEAYNNIQKIRDKLGKYKVLVDVLQGGNPVKAADTLLEMATGEGLITRIAQYQPFKKLMKFDALKQALLTGNLDKDALMRQVAEKNLPQEMIDTYDTLMKFKNDPQGMIKTEAGKQINAIIDANPELRNLVDNYTAAQDYLENPEKIEAEFKSQVKKAVVDQIRSMPEVQQLEAAVAKQEEKLKALEKNVREQLEDAGTATLKEIMNSSMAKELESGLVVAYMTAESTRQDLEEKLNRVMGTAQIEELSTMHKEIMTAADKIKKINTDMALDPENFTANLTRSVTGQFGRDAAQSTASATAFVKTVINDYQFAD